MNNTWRRWLMTGVVAVLAAIIGLTGSPANAAISKIAKAPDNVTIQAWPSSLAAGADPTPTGTGASVAAVYPCNVTWIVNQRMGTGWYARSDPPGPYTWTWTQETHYGHTGPRVAEIQCLLQFLDGVHPGIEWPGSADGEFGSNTQRSVVSAQKICFPSEQWRWDGAVGPVTWPCIRRTVWDRRANPV